MFSIIIVSLAISPAFAESRNQEQPSDQQMHQEVEVQEHSRTSDGEPTQWQPEGAPEAYGHIPAGPDRKKQEGKLENDRRPHEEYSDSETREQHDQDGKNETLRNSNIRDWEHGIQGGAHRYDNDIGRSTTRIHRDTGE
ncbi:hypothetical protein [Desulfonatronum parangueonense]